MTEPTALVDRAAEAKKLRKALTNLTGYVHSFLILLDYEMKKPSTPERGRRIADLANKLELKNDMITRFTLNKKRTRVGSLSSLGDTGG